MQLPARGRPVEGPRAAGVRRLQIRRGLREDPHDVAVSAPGGEVDRQGCAARLSAVRRGGVGAPLLSSGTRRPPTLTRSSLAIGWHYLSNATCLVRHHLLSTALFVLNAAN